MDAKNALDSLIAKARVHFYKPIQVAEILYYYRTKKHPIDPIQIDTYRNISKRWRDEVSLRLVGSKSISSARYQDDVFNANAIPPTTLAELIKINNSSNGGVEAYIYRRLEEKLSAVHSVGIYINSSTTDSFLLDRLVQLFESNSGLARSMDKIYEIITYALFSSIVTSLRAQVTLELLNEDKEILHDFNEFINAVLGIDEYNTKLVSPAALYRVGATNAADAGLDMWANFGPAFQVKHLTLTAELAGGITDGVSVDKLVIICKDAEKEPIENLLRQLGLENKLQGIITFSDLNKWYTLCMSDRYKDKLGNQLLQDLDREYSEEFPSSSQVKPFLEEREYQNAPLPQGWTI